MWIKFKLLTCRVSNAGPIANGAQIYEYENTEDLHNKHNKTVIGDVILVLMQHHDRYNDGGGGDKNNNVDKNNLRMKNINITKYFVTYNNQINVTKIIIIIIIIIIWLWKFIIDKYLTTFLEG
jgi:hypothetical protein